MEISLRTLTPIWTGGVETGTMDRIHETGGVETGTMDRIHETGIIGSLRWWYEVIVRGLGGDVCDPTSHSCIYDPEKPNDGLCNVCRLFGATGWRRRFRLTVHDTGMRPQSVTSPMEAKRSYEDPRGKTKTPIWYFGKSPQTGEFVLQIQSLNPQFPAEVIGELIQFIADRAAIGAKSQMGFGVVEIKGNRLESNQLRRLSFTNNRPIDLCLPSLQNIFFARIKKQNAQEVDTFNLKYDLRRLFADDQTVRHFVMGTAQKERRIAAKIHMSRPNNGGHIRVWGWIPQEAQEFNNPWNRNTILDAVNSHLKTEYDLEVWREFNSQRDTLRAYSDIHDYLHSLLVEES